MISRNPVASQPEMIRPSRMARSRSARLAAGSASNGGGRFIGAQRNGPTLGPNGIPAKPTRPSPARQLARRAPALAPAVRRTGTCCRLLPADDWPNGFAGPQPLSVRLEDFRRHKPDRRDPGRGHTGAGDGSNVRRDRGVAKPSAGRDHGHRASSERCIHHLSVAGHRADPARYDRARSHRLHWRCCAH